MEKSQLLFCFCVLIITVQFSAYNCKIFSRKLNDANFKTLNFNNDAEWPAVLNRFRVRRDSNSESKPAPLSTSTQLGTKNDGFNEAIVHWSGENSKAIFVLTRQHLSNGTVPKSMLWRSMDYGSTFRPVPLPDSNIRIKYFYTCPNNKNKLIFTDAQNKRLYSTSDEGDTLKGHQLIFIPDKLLFHPTLEDWVLGYSYEDRQLYVSNDLGASWSTVRDRVNARFFWAVPLVDGNDKLIHLEVEDLATGEYIYEAMSADMMSPEVNYPHIGTVDVDSLLVENDYIFVQKTTPFHSLLFVSYKRAPFKQAYFPLEAHPEHFSIVSTDQQQVFIAADHRGSFVNLYLSDPSGSYYVKSLDNLVVLRRSSGNFEVDLAEIRALNGTYIVNQNINGQSHSFITFDEGGEWSNIAAPLKDIDGKSINCKLDDGCSLHLHLSFSMAIYGIQYIVSEQNAPGIIMAQGVIGDHLVAQESTLFISRDGGANWNPVLKGDYTHNILDQGGAMVAVRANSQNHMTDSIEYSCNSGRDWQKYKFIDKPIFVDGVLNEPGINTRVISIFGHSSLQDGWSIVKLDFSPVLSRKCSPGDYDNWSPADKLSDKGCLLGQKVTYYRRKPLAECYNGDNFQHTISTEICKCERDDYECDYGYKENDKKICMKEDWFDPNHPPGDCPEGTQFPKSKGYRRIAASKCKGGALASKYAPISTNCQLTAPSDIHVYSNTKQVAALGKPVTFHISQQTGSKKSTKYSWSCGSGTRTAMITGYEKAETFNCTYTKIGKYVVVVNASNSEGRETTSTAILIEEQLKGAYVLEPHAAAAGFPVQLEAEVIIGSGPENGAGYVHYVWTFGDEDINQQPLLGYNNQVQHTFVTAGNYTCSVTAINSISTIYRQFSAIVYGTLQTVQLSFHSSSFGPTSNTLEWRRLLAAAISTKLQQVLSVDPQRLEVVVLPVSPDVADVSILPLQQLMKKDDSIDKIVATLLKKANNLSIPLDPAVFGYNQEIVVTSARLLDTTPGTSRNYTAVYVCVPILVLAVFVSALVVMYYKKKFTSIRHRYSMLHNRNAGPDSVLDDTDDDDDPLLEPELQPTRLSINQHDDDPLGDGDI